MTNLLNNITPLSWLLIAVTIADIVFGVACAWANGNLESRKFRRGIVEHIGTLTVLLAVKLYLRAENAGSLIVVADTFYWGVIASYGVSMLETLRKSGATWVPDWLVRRLKDKAEIKENEDEKYK